MGPYSDVLDCQCVIYKTLADGAVARRGVQEPTNRLGNSTHEQTACISATMDVIPSEQGA